MDAAKDDDDDGQSGTRPPSTSPSLSCIASHSPFCVVWLTKQMSGWHGSLLPPFPHLPIFPDTALATTEKPFMPYVYDRPRRQMRLLDRGDYCRAAAALSLSLSLVEAFSLIDRVG